MSGQGKSANARKERQGVVLSRSGAKSVVVLVEGRRQHPLYGKVVRFKKKFHVHDEKNEANLGDKVRIAECRPISHLKRWRLLEVTR
jgi:small subunit ribosomal protein S17